MKSFNEEKYGSHFIKLLTVVITTCHSKLVVVVTVSHFQLVLCLWLGSSIYVELGRLKAFPQILD